MSGSSGDAGTMSLAAIRELEKIANFDVPATQLERAKANEIIVAFAEANLQEKLRDYRKGTVALLDLIGLLAPRVEALGSGGARVVADAAALLRLVHDGEGMRSAAPDATAAETAAVADEANLPPPPTPPAARTLSAGADGRRLAAPTPISSTHYEMLADEYVRFFLGADISEHGAAVGDMADRAMASRRRYEAVGNPLGIPWWFIAAIHMLESTFNPNTHLHNGDPLGARTKRVPANRPATGNPPFTWEDSARDALALKRLGGLRDWSLPRALFRWETYNGWGYRSLGVPSPYLWSMSSIYGSGKFVADHVFDRRAVSKQCGAASLLKALHQRGAVDLHLDYTDDGAEDDPAPAPVPPAPGSFAAFLLREIPDLQNFEAEEFLFLGNNNAAAPPASRNAVPAKELWTNVVPLVRVMMEFRKRTNRPVVFNSVYRNPVYNAFVGGELDSQHMKFRACDFHVLSGGGEAGDWADMLRTMRREGLFSGGIGLYPRFVHVDTRGFDVDWHKT